MKIPLALLLLPTSALLLGVDVRMWVTDETMQPIAGAKTMIAFTTIVHGGDATFDGLTDRAGVFFARGRAQHSVIIDADKDGHYKAHFDRLPRDRDWNLTVVLPRVINPIPLLARESTVWKAPRDGQPRELEISGETIGFDFAMGEMVAPYGKGQIADVLFKIRNEFKGWKYSDRDMEETRRAPINRNTSESNLKFYHGKFDAELGISFPGAQEGLVEEKDHFLPYSRLKMPHRAPETGYAPTWHYTANTYSPSTARDDVGFFLRARVKLDKEGRIVSANYAKIMGDFRLDARGSISFTYYFNPTPNDRNLEFDPKRNLFPASVQGADVRDP